MDNEVYYRIYQLYNGKLTIVCMQWFDEYDYDEKKFMTDEEGNKLRFDTEEQASEWLNNNVKEFYIDDEYLKVGFNRNKYLK